MVLLNSDLDLVAGPVQVLPDVQQSSLSAEHKGVAFESMVTSSQVVPAVPNDVKKKAARKRPVPPATKEVRVPTRQIYEALSNVLQTMLGCSFGIAINPAPLTPVKEGQVRAAVPMLAALAKVGGTSAQKKFFKHSNGEAQWDSFEELQLAACNMGHPFFHVTMTADEGSTGWSLFWYLVSGDLSGNNTCHKTYAVKQMP